MVSLPESDDDQTVTTLASPSFQSMLDGDASSEYETDLEEEFPGGYSVLSSPSPVLGLQVKIYQIACFHISQTYM